MDYAFPHQYTPSAV